jgi:hypothetical protein
VDLVELVNPMGAKAMVVVAQVVAIDLTYMIG